MQTSPKIIDEKVKKPVLKERNSIQNSSYQNYGIFDEYLEKNGIELSKINFWQKLMSNNKARVLFVLVCCWLFNFLVTVILNLIFSENDFSLVVMLSMATLGLLFVPVCPAVLIPFESFIYKWKAKKLRNLFLRDWDFSLSKDSLLMNELDIYLSLKKFFNTKAKEYKVEDLWGLKVFKVWQDWPKNKYIYPDGFLKTGYYFMNNFAGKSYTVRSRNDIVKMLMQGADFEKRIDQVFIDRNASPGDVKKLIDDLFFTLLVADEMNREYEFHFGERHKESMEKNGFAIVI